MSRQPFVWPVLYARAARPMWSPLCSPEMCRACLDCVLVKAGNVSRARRLKSHWRLTLKVPYSRCRTAHSGSGVNTCRMGRALHHCAAFNLESFCMFNSLVDTAS